MRLRPACLLPVSLLLVACASSPPSRAPDLAPAPVAIGTVAKAQAALAPASASLVSGRLVLVGEPGAVRLTGTVGGLPPDARVAFHIHEKGDCSAADASSAGAHFNPAGQAHGGPDTTVRHLGDLDNLTADSRGRVNVEILAPAVVLGGGASNDILGRALVIHAQPDDHHSQPAGNAGSRIACGPIRALP